MRNFIILCRLHTEQVLHAAFSGLKTSKKDPKAITAVLILAVFSVLMSALYGFLFAGMMTQSGTELFYFPTMLLLSLFFGFLFICRALDAACQCSGAVFFHRSCSRPLAVLFARYALFPAAPCFFRGALRFFICMDSGAAA